MLTNITVPPWQVFLIGGSSGTGKTTLAMSLGRHWGLPSLEMDDFRLTLKYVIQLAQSKHCENVWEKMGLQALLEVEKYFGQPDSSPEAMSDALIATANVMSRSIEMVIANHIATQTPVIIEGDGLLPALVHHSPMANLVPQPGQVQAVFLVEDDEERLWQNALRRGRGFDELPVVEQRRVIKASWLYGQWLKAEANAAGAPVVSCCPYETLADRVREAVKN